MLALTADAFGLPDDQYQPIEIQADSATHHEKSGLTSYNGNVVMKQGSLRVEADNVTVSNALDKKSTHLIASGHPAKFQQQPEPDRPIIFAEATSINYQLDIGRIELVGNARLLQGESKIQSARIFYMVEDQIFKAEGITTDTSQPPERVQIIIPAPKKPETPSPDIEPRKP